MLIPLGTDRPNERKAVITPVLIGANLGVFVVLALLHSANPELAASIEQWGAVKAQGFRPWQPVTSAFLHAGFMHIFGNMLFLLVFGPPVEDRLGRIGFAALYLVGAAASGLTHIAVDPHPAVGASGAVAAVSGAFLVLFPRTRIKCFVIFIFIGVFAVPSWWLIGLFIALDLIGHVFTPENGIANMAHLGGYAFGIGVAFTLLITGVLPREPYDLFSIMKHKQRKRAFASAHKQYEAQTSRVRADARSVRHDPVSDEIAETRAEIGAMVSSGQPQRAADAYLAMQKKYAGQQNRPLTMNRDAQYAIANALYQRGDRVQAADAFARLLDTYPSDPERHVITVLIARTRAQEQHDPVGAIELLEELASRAHDDETQALIDQELRSIRAMGAPDQEPQS